MKVRIAEGDCYKDLRAPRIVSPAAVQSNERSVDHHETKHGGDNTYGSNKIYKAKKRYKNLFRYHKHFRQLNVIPECEKFEMQEVLHKMEPQSGEVDIFEKISTTLADISKYAGVALNDELMSTVEGLGAMLIAVQGSTDYVSMSASIFLFARKYFDKSVTGQIMAYLSEMFEFETQDGPEDLVKTPEWLNMMRHCRDNWALIRGNKFFSHFSKLLGLIVVAGMCKASSVTFEVKEYKIWEPDMKLIHGSACDVLDAALTTVTFFVENIYMCWQQGSLKPLLVNDKAAAELDEEYANIVLWWDLVKNGNLEKVAGVTEQEFDKRLETLTSTIRNLVGMKGSFEKKLIEDKFMRLLRIRNDYITMKICSGVRKAPYCMELYGGSSQGKTTLGEQLLQALLTSAKLPTSKEYQASYNASDKFMSTWSSSKLVMTIDDLANETSNFVERPPTRAIIDICNNQPFYANMADLDSKGKVFVEPEICLVTTNVKDLDARCYSNCPFSVQRRMHNVLTVKAKPEFQYVVDGRPQGIDAQKVEAMYKDGNTPTFDDIWTITVEKAIEPSDLRSAASYGVVSYKGEKLENTSFRKVVQYLIEDFAAHRRAQDGIISRMKKRQQVVERCDVDGCCQIKGYCDKHELEKQYGEVILDALQTASGRIVKKFKKDLFGIDTAVEGACAALILGGARMFMRKWDWISAIPTPWLQNNHCRNALMFMNQGKLKKRYVQKTCLLWTGLAGTVFMCNRYCPQVEGKKHLMLGAAAFCAGVGISVQKDMVERVKEEFSQELVDRNTISPMIREFRDAHVGRLCAGVAIIGIMYTIAKVYRAWRDLNPQGSLEPATEEEVKERDAESNPYTTVVPRSLPVATSAANTTAEQLEKMTAKNLLYGSVEVNGKVYMVDGFVPRTALVVIPDHYFTADKLKVTFNKDNPDAAGGKFTTYVTKNLSYLVPGEDIRYCYLSSGGSFRDLTKYIVDEELPEHEFTMLWRSKQGKLTTAHGLAEPRDTSNGAVSFRGYRYKTMTIDTFKGLCGAVLLSRRKPILTSVHLGGKSGTPHGCAGKLRKKDIDAAIAYLSTKEGVLFTGSADNFETQVLGVNVIKSKDIHAKSPLNYMPADSQVEYYGECPGMSTFVSDVRKTPISDLVAEVTGLPNIYRPPVQHPQYYGWQTCLASLANPARPFDPDVLEVAVKDYKSGLTNIFSSNLWKDARPLTDHENLCGIPGKKFMDAIKLNTSIGFPLSGPKRNFVIELEPTPDKPNNRILDQIIMDEIQRCEDCYRRGERAYPIAKACKKDEIVTKEKCRIFYGNSIALTWLVRKRFLPLLRVLQMNPLKSECAVGINSHGPEWEELHKHTYKFGEERLIGGDYGKYDQKLPSQLLLAAIRVLIDFARLCNYTDEDLMIMEAMAGDIVYAVIAFNGDLIGLTQGTHISGNSLTVILNGIAGSLNLRCCLYTLYPPKSFEERIVFREHVALMTYGDDNIGSASNHIPKFTIKSISEFLDEHGQVYTMPDKESELLDYLPKSEWEFLKRKSVYHPELDVHLGALCDASCAKMLHCYLRGKNAPLTEEHACAQNIDTTIREKFNHGEESYEQWRAWMKEVAQRSHISHLCTELDSSYRDRVKDWKDKYIFKVYEKFNEPDGFEF